MKFFKVKPQFDNVTIYVRTKSGALKPDSILVGNELYTQAEFLKLKEKSDWLKDYMFEEVEVSKFKTYWFFGARFMNEEALV